MFNIFMCVYLTLMNSYYSIKRESWESGIIRLTSSYNVFAVVDNGYSLDYEMVDNRNISSIVYNKPKPSTPLKTFFLPVRENVTSETISEKARIIIGSPNCDVEALSILDEIYLDKSFEDVFYRNRRDNTIIISSDCFEIQDHCHCISYNINPYSTSKADVAVILRNDQILLRVISEKGDEFVKNGKVDRPALGKIIFADPTVKKELETFLHPKIRAAIEELSLIHI